MNSLTFPILRLLADGQFHSGEALARDFGVTRATVWNALQAAEALGVQVFSVRGKGYRLPEPMQFLAHDKVLAALAAGDSEAAPEITLQTHDQLDSTNSHLMRLAAEGAPHGLCAVVELQTGGRGRRGRTWMAGLGSGLTFSLLWRFDCGASGLSGLSLAVGVALARALQELGVPGTGLKWPNDVLHRQKKLAGVLIELQGDMDGPSAAVIGIGLNLHLPEALKNSIGQPVTDIASITNGVPDRSHALGALLRHLIVVLREFERAGFAALREEWMTLHAHHEQPVCMLMPDGSEVRGIASGVAPDGALLLAIGDGMQRFSSGEVSLRAA
jgi:BirA family biotin operon repressor/biotin-[acetyl-CoA-carboxylase] ligase